METVVLAVLFVAISILFFMVEKENASNRRIFAPKNPIGSGTTQGMREVQQDAFGSALGDDGALLVVADGMGPGQGGKIAAKIAVDTFVDLYQDYQAIDKPQYYFRRAYNLANHKILETLDVRTGTASAAVALIRGDLFYYALVGSIKVAVFRGTDLVPVSEGQTIDVLAQHRYKEGRISKETAISLLTESRLYNVLGDDSFNDIEFFSEPIKLLAGDVVVLMTDGVPYALKWTQIEDALRAGGTPEEMARRIIDAVNASTKEDKDNATVLVYRN